MTNQKDKSIDLVWGAEAIGEIIGRTRRSTFEILEKGELPAAKKVNGRWVIERGALLRFFTGEAA